jgi:hypothetical protein
MAIQAKGPAPLAGGDRASGLLRSAASNPTHKPASNSNQSPSPEAIAACDEFILDELARTFDLIESFAISGKEAARRRDPNEVKLRLRTQLRDCFRHAVEIHDLLSSTDRCP